MSHPGRRRSIPKDKGSGRAPIAQRPKLNVRFVFGPNSSSPKPNAVVRGPQDLGSSFSTTHIDEWDVTKHPYSHRVRGLPSGSISAFPVVLRDPCLENGQNNPEVAGHISEGVSSGSHSTGPSLERSVSSGLHPGWEQFNSGQTTSSLRETPTSLQCSSEDHTLLPNRNTYQTDARSHELANRTSNPCTTPITGPGDPLDTEGEVSLDALSDIINLFQNTQNIEDSEVDVPGPLPSTSVLPAHHLAVPQHVPDLNSHFVPYGTYPQAIAIPATSPHGAGPSFLQFPTMNFAMHPQYLQPLQQASVLASQSPNGFTGPIQQFPVLQYPQAAFHYPINPYLSYPPQTAYLQIPINPFFPPPVLAPVVPAQGDIWSTVFEHATDVRRQNTANRKRRKRTSSGRRAIPDAEHFCCPFCYRLFLRSNSYALHLKAHREAALNVIQILQNGASTEQASDDARPSSSGNDEPDSQPARSRRPTKRTRLEGRRARRSHSVAALEPPIEAADTAEPAEEPRMYGPITPLATPPRSTCKSANAMWYQPETPVQRERTCTGGSSRWQEELFGSDDMGV